MSSPLVPVTSNIVVAIYLSKFLATPFKQLEIYGKLLKEIQRYTEVCKSNSIKIKIKYKYYYTYEGLSCR